MPNMLLLLSIIIFPNQNLLVRKVEIHEDPKALGVLKPIGESVRLVTRRVRLRASIAETEIVLGRCASSSLIIAKLHRLMCGR